MHSLFTRVFVSFWLSILLIAAGAAAITAVYFVADRSNPVALTRQAQAVLRDDGIEGLRSWLSLRNARARAEDERPSRMLIVDASGREILGQRLPGRGPPPGAHRPRPDGPPPDQAGGERGPPERPPHELRDRPRGPDPRAMEIRGSDGAVYRAFFDPPPRGGPFSPPYAWPVRGGLLLLALAISGLVSYALARSIAGPLEGLQGTVRELSKGNLGARAPARTGQRRDEIGLLAREFDAMAERLGELIAARTRLLRDISHELRSPLARLQMAVGLARQNAASREEQLDRIEREGERLGALIAQVLEYARFERDPSSLQHEPVDLAALLQQILHDAEFETQSAVGRITLTVGAGMPMLQGDAPVLHAAFDNVVRNALLHAGQGPVELHLTHEAGMLCVQVCDRGSGVPDAELTRIFEPFHRVLRTQTEAVEGSGIGLAVTARAVQLHGGTVSAANRAGGGLVVEIRLPVGPQTIG